LTVVTRERTGRSLEGRSSDEVPDLLALGDGQVTVGVFSMSSRSPTREEDARYFEWHLLDHLPEQYRLETIHHGARWTSTPECRAARPICGTPLDPVDHVVNYLLTPPVGPGMTKFWELYLALRDAGRMGPRLPRVHSGIYRIADKVTAPDVVSGADVLPWRPAQGVYLVVEEVTGGDDRPEEIRALSQLDGVAGAWWYAGGVDVERATQAESPPAYRVTVCYLDVRPLQVADSLAQTLQRRWDKGGIVPLLAAPLEIVVPWQWDRYLP